MSAESANDPRRDRIKLVEGNREDLPAEARRAAEPRSPAAPVADVAPPKARPLRTALLGLIGLAALGAAGWYGQQWWTTGRFIVSTDDAYVGAEMATVSAKLPANVAEIAVAQNREVRAGDLLVRLDDGDQRIALEASRAKSATAAATLARIDSQIEAGKASLLQARAQRESAQADVTRTSADFERASSLAAKSFGSQATLDAATAGRDRARAALTSAEAGVTAAEANVAVIEAQRVEAARQLAELKIVEQKAERDLSFTRIVAPIDGMVANTGVQLGDLVSSGKRLMSIVPLDQVYVDANFKETQLGPLKIGDKAKITVDALPGRVFEGTVSGIAGGTGSVFSLLPPDNATGNFTKIVQRVPVRIALAPDEVKRHVLRPGMSVVVAIDPRSNGGH